MPGDVQITGTESRIGIARGGGREVLGVRYCAVSIEFQFCKMKRVLQMDGSNGCVIMCMVLMPLNCIFKNG